MERQQYQIAPDFELFDSDGIQVLWRSQQDLQEWLKGKQVTPILKPSPITLRGGRVEMQMMVTRINIH